MTSHPPEHSHNRSIRLCVPAKINLFLHVTGRRANGYHELESIFCPIDWFDDLQLSLSNEPGVRRYGGLADVPAGLDLSVKAAKAFLQAVGADQHQGVDIHLEKHIPSGAGLGGGSADAAFTLMGLNHLLGAPFDLPQLHPLATRLGADVPFFLGGEPAFVSGIGDILQAIDIPTLHLVVIKPAVHMPTEQVFKHPDLTRDSPSVKMSVFGFSDACARVAHVGETTGNSLEAVAGLISADITVALDFFKQCPARLQPQWSRMTGSGSAVFGVFEHAGQAADAAQYVHRLLEAQRLCQWQVRAVNTLRAAHLKNQTVHTL
jgi:4-diphosphocytidyl-2-C-methyl-D-erythritol kinase